MLQDAAQKLLLQMEEVLGQCKEEDYKRPLAELEGATLGMHVRHTLEFFICLRQGIDQQCINYDNRKHDSKLETCRKAATQVIEEVRSFLEQDFKDFPLVLEANYSIESNEDTYIHSSFFRELAYTIEHAIHHMALMAVAVRVGFSYIQLPESFGVASSTIRYRKKLVQQ